MLNPVPVDFLSFPYKRTVVFFRTMHFAITHENLFRTISQSNFFRKMLCALGHRRKFGNPTWRLRLTEILALGRPQKTPAL